MRSINYFDGFEIGLFSLIVFVLFVFCSSFSAGQVVKDVSVVPSFNSIENNFVDGLFIISNLNHTIGFVDKIFVSLFYNISSFNNSMDVISVSSNSSNHSINKFVKSNTGSFNFSDDFPYFSVCAKIVVNVTDPNKSNNFGCWNFTQHNFNLSFINNSEINISNNNNNNNNNSNNNSSNNDLSNNTSNNTSNNSSGYFFYNNTENNSQVNSSINSSINFSQNISNNLSFVNSSLNSSFCDNFSIVGVPDVVLDGEKFYYSFLGVIKGDNIIYWIEDLFENVVKSSVSTFSLSKRSYTPHSDFQRALVVRAIRIRDGCPDVSSKKVFVVYSNDSVDDAEESVVQNNLDFEIDSDPLFFGDKLAVSLFVDKSTNYKSSIYVSLCNNGVSFQKQIIKLNKKGSFVFSLEFPIVDDSSCVLSGKNIDLKISGLGEEFVEPVFLEHRVSCENILFENEKDKDVANPLFNQEISSLYVLAKNYQSSIILRGKSNFNSSGFLLVNDFVRKVNVSKGSFSFDISPKKNNNSVLLFFEHDGLVFGKSSKFFLKTKEEEIRDGGFEELKAQEDIGISSFKTVISKTNKSYNNYSNSINYSKVPLFQGFYIYNSKNNDYDSGFKNNGSIQNSNYADKNIFYLGSESDYFNSSFLQKYGFFKTFLLLVSSFLLIFGLFFLKEQFSFIVEKKRFKNDCSLVLFHDRQKIFKKRH